MPDKETGVVFQRGFGFIHAANVGESWSLPQPAGELGKLLKFTDSIHLHAAIVQIAHPTAHAQRTRRVLDEIAESDALHASPDPIQPCCFSCAQGRFKRG